MLFLDDRTRYDEHHQEGYPIALVVAELGPYPVREGDEMRLLWGVMIGLVVSVGNADEAALGPTAMRQLTIELLRNEANAKTTDAKADAIATLCDLYAAIRVHPLYEQSDILHGEAIRVRRRLLTASREWSDRLERAKVTKPTDISSRVDAALVTSEVEPAAGGGAAPGGVGGEGWELVELIQRTVRPDFWEVAGGPGSIRYFAIKRVLVVRATTEVHQELAKLLGQL